MTLLSNAFAEETQTTTEEILTETETEIELEIETTETTETVGDDYLDINVGQALSYAGVGFAIVFIALFIIIGAIKLTSIFVSKTAKKAEAEKPAEAPAVPAAAAEKPAAPGSCGELKLYNVSDKDAAMIMAIVADEMKTPLNELRFISIKEIA